MQRESASPANGRVLTAFVLLMLLAVLGSCAPAPTQTATDRRPGSDLQRIALQAYHRMEIGLLETGSYTTNVLVDLELPRQVRWTLEEFGSDGYRLRFTADDRPDEAWLVTPAGVSRAEPAG